MREIALLGVPIDCVGEAGGTELSPRALRRAGIVERLGASDAGDVPVAIRGKVRDPSSGVQALPSVISTIAETRDATRELLREGRWPLLMAGDCTAAISGCAALRDRYRDLGVAYVDGHLDLYDGFSSPTGESADFPLAVVCGYGPRELRVAAHVSDPIVDPARVSLLGPRDYEEAEGYGSVLPEQMSDELVYLDVEGVRADPAAAGRRGAEHAAAGTAGYWVHLDLDVLDEEEFPATDVLAPNGLSWAELDELMPPLIGSPECLGMTVACYNPEKDPDGSQGERIVESLAAALAGDEA